jgi:hypothetical protein
MAKKLTWQKLVGTSLRFSSLCRMIFFFLPSSPEITPKIETQVPTLISNPA